ncbi:hypothetical protein WJX73_003150 [Symbiochloris irregularis]|uniref:Uncharacterized protein n=1 Tax=Symbiochloris irregularis TaxID=706552 RepID=A0AAW1PVK1_9CHLO
MNTERPGKRSASEHDAHLWPHFRPRSVRPQAPASGSRPVEGSAIELAALAGSSASLPLGAPPSALYGEKTRVQLAGSRQDGDPAKADEDSVAKIITQGRLSVNVQAGLPNAVAAAGLPDPLSFIPGPGLTSGLSVGSASSSSARSPRWIRNTVKRKPSRYGMMLGHKAGPTYDLVTAWNRNELSAEPVLGPLNSPSWMLYAPGPRGRECVGRLEGNNTQSTFLLIMPTVPGAQSACDPNLDPVTAAISFDRRPDGQRHVVVLMPGSQSLTLDGGMAKQHLDLGHSDAVEALLQQALKGETMPAHIRVLRNKDAEPGKDKKGRLVKTLDFQGRVTRPSCKNLQLQCESRPRSWPRLRMPHMRTFSTNDSPTCGSTRSLLSIQQVFQDPLVFQ